MGGSISVIIREEDGKIHKIEGWTNPLPRFVNNFKFINSDKQHLQEYFNSYVNNYISLDGGYIAPCGYGLVLMDYQTKTLLSSQSYCDFGELYSSDIFHFNVQDDYEKEIIQKLIDERKIIHANAIGKRDDNEGVCELEIEYKQDDKDRNTVAFKNIKNTDDFFLCINADYIITGYALNMSPWKIEYIEDSSKGFAKLKEKIIELGFEITEEDERIWNEYLKYYDDEE